jgi:hypothetical protein
MLNQRAVSPRGRYLMEAAAEASKHVLGRRFTAACHRFGWTPREKRVRRSDRQHDSGQTLLLTTYTCHDTVQYHLCATKSTVVFPSQLNSTQLD